jgi:hypothetical protein
MRFRKHLLGFVVFLAVFSSIICVYEYLYGPLGFGPFLVERRAEPPATVAEPSAAEYDVRLVSLDFINGQTYTTLVLKLRPGQPAPEKLLVSTRFYVPGGGEDQSWTTTAGVTRPRAAGGRVEVTIASECYWCDRPDAPRDGYFADVYVSAQYEGETFPLEPDGHPAGAAIPVVVQAGRKQKR